MYVNPQIGCWNLHEIHKKIQNMCVPCKQMLRFWKKFEELKVVKKFSRSIISIFCKLSAIFAGEPHLVSQFFI